MVANAADISNSKASNKAIGLICAGHFFSHFYMLLLPPLFPVLKEVYGVGFTELGIAITVFSTATALVQAPVGFLVDKYGARALLVAALLIESVAFALIGVFQDYSALLILMAIAGLANSVFHPADYAILNASVDPKRMGRAFSLHSLGAQLGNMAGPLTILALVAWMDVGVALIACGVGGIVVAIVMAMGSGVLSDATSPGQARRQRQEGPPQLGGMALLLSAPILSAFVFCACTALYNRGVSSFGVSTIHLLNDIPLGEAGIVLTGYLVASPVGVLFGGWLADRTRRHATAAATAFIVISIAAALLAAFPTGVVLATALFAVIGFCSGTVTPSRDMIIRSVTPPGEMGKVYGFVSTGLNVSGVVGPPLYGYLLDNGEPAIVFWTVSAVAAISIVTVTVTGANARKAAL